MAIQSATATFTGAETYVDLTWSTNYSSFVLLAGVTTTDGSIIGIRLTNPSDQTMAPVNTGVRVEPSALFSGQVFVVCLEVL